MRKIKITNVGTRERSRVGVKLKPGQSTEKTVSSRDFLILRSIRSFKIEELEAEQEKQEEQHQEPEKEAPADDLEQLQGLNRDDFMAKVKELELDPQEALEIEQEGQGRKSIIEALEKQLPKGED